MSLIACTSSCIYQKDGRCTLERVASNRADHSSDGLIGECFDYVGLPDENTDKS